MIHKSVLLDVESSTPMTPAGQKEPAYDFSRIRLTMLMAKDIITQDKNVKIITYTTLDP